MMMRILTMLAMGCVLLLAGCSHVKPHRSSTRAFDFYRDTFAFPNELIWTYKDGVRVAPIPTSKPKEERYTHHCFVLSRAVVQFWKFARFEPDSPRLSAEALRERIRMVAGRDTKDAPLPFDKRVVFPGYTDLRDMSKRDAPALRANLGPSLPTYFRLGNFFLPFDMSAEHQTATDAEIKAWLDVGQPMALWIFDFKFPHPRLNHAVTTFAASEADGKRIYRIYDPVHPEEPKWMEFDPKTSRFSYQKTSYFGGGPIWVRPCYVNAVE